MFVVTGKTFNTAGNWMGGEAIIRLEAGPTWTGEPTYYWAPTNWFSLDHTDTDLGGVSATVIDAPGATPSQPVLALGKDSECLPGRSHQSRRYYFTRGSGQRLLALTEGRQLSPIIQIWEHILRSTTTPARSGPTRLRQQIRQRSCLRGR